MHQLAIALHLEGHLVSGSDDEIFDPALSNLRRYNLVHENYFWDSDKISEDIDLVILGMHARNDNPELIKAKEIGLDVVSFPEYIYRRSRNKKRVVIGGSHGKTTITSMIMHVLRECGRPFDYLVGSRVRGFDVMVSLDESNDAIVIEGDEYLSSCLDPRPKFHHYHPDIAVVSGIEWDHINVFPVFEQYVDAFRTYVNSVPAGGSIIYCNTDENVAALMGEYGGQAEKVPYEAVPYEIDNNEVKVFCGVVPIAVNVFGEHNMLNMSAAFEVCRRLGISDESFFSAIAGFEGAARRLENIHESDGLRIFRDFAHAPSKLKATVKAVKTRYPDDLLLAVFELHTFSSMNREFLTHYASALDLADVAAVYFSPHAFDLKKLKAFTAAEIREGFNRRDITVLNEPESLLEFVAENMKKPVSILLMSSGNFDNANFDRIPLLNK
ncbi:UDP-N-acetylmuramate--L-alanyl-gamma-D-glutamyl-meso-2,6-diaminoheptandioate ligase [bioreactor metagenome]|uniref:UDP-N-acetylmuramate--L-alanyl-gamma-D-glutamyl-meso-2,6-diaminoheptandioate ligase n=1 Tax=bioreactor metagenome TaxID=1076179 RepID=A0A644YJ42_9ZZZZ